MKYLAAIGITIFVGVLMFEGNQAIWGASNILSLQQQSNGIAILVDGKQVGLAASLNFMSGNGIVQSCALNGQRIDCTPNYNTATIVTRSLSVQSVDHFCKPSGKITSFACSTPTPAAWCPPEAPGYPAGVWVDMLADSGTLTSAMINVNKCGNVNIKLADGATDPGTAIKNGSMYHLVSDGTVFRIE